MTKQSNNSHLRHLIVWTLVSFAIVFFGLYSFSPLSREDLKTVNTQLLYIQDNTGYRKNWVTFYSEEGQKFYCQTNTLDIKRASKLVEILEKYNEEELTILYTSRMDLLPLNICYFWGYDRVVAIEFEGSPIISLEEYNSSSFEMLIGIFIVAVIALLIGTFPYIFIKIICMVANGKSNKGNTGDGSVC